MLYVCENTCMPAQTAAAKTHALPDVAGRAAGYGIPASWSTATTSSRSIRRPTPPSIGALRRRPDPDRVQDLPPARPYRAPRAARSARPGGARRVAAQGSDRTARAPAEDQGELDDAKLQSIDGGIMAALESAVAFAGRARSRCPSRRRRRLFSLTQSKRDERSNAEDAEDTQRTRRRLSRAQRATITARGMDCCFAPAQCLRALCVPFASFALKRCFSRLRRGRDDARADIQRGALEAVAEEMRRDPRSSTCRPTRRRRCSRSSATSGSGRRRSPKRPLPAWRSARPAAAFRPIADWRQVDVRFVAMIRSSSSGEDPLHVRRPGQLPDPVPGVGRRRRPGRGQHSQSPYSMFMNVAGLKMFLPSTPYDMKGLLKTAIRATTRHLFESSRLWRRKGTCRRGRLHDPFGKADINARAAR